MRKYYIYIELRMNKLIDNIDFISGVAETHLGTLFYIYVNNMNKVRD